MRSLYLRALSALLLLSVYPVAAQQSTVIYQGKQVMAKQLILRLRDNSPEALARVAARFSDVTITPISPSLGVHFVKSGSNNVEALMSAYAPDSDVLYAEPNYILRGTAIPNDPQYAQLWGIQKIAAPQAWDVTTGSKTAVGILDTGIDYTHPDLAANVWTAPAAYSVTIGGQTLTCPAGSHGFNALAMSCDPKDDNSHGSHVAGTIGAVGNNAVGVAGVNWTTQIVAIKFLDASGIGSLSDALNCVEYAIQLKNLFASSSTPVNLRVLSASWGGSDFSQSLLDEINSANSNGLLFVAAAGNGATSNDATPFYPAGFSAPNMIAVAATQPDDTLASFSNYGAATVHLGAPGVSILSTVAGGGYAYYSGTSMATPHVAGAALLTLSACPALTTSQLKSTLLASVDPAPALQGKTITGGRLNVSKAIQSCTGPPPASQTCIASVAADHWRGEYFNNITLSGSPLMVRDDGTDVLNFTWGFQASPSAACNLPGVVWSARWTRTLTFSSGTYRFTTSSDDGMRLYVDGTKVLDRWFDQGATAVTTDVPMTAGTHTVVVEYYQNTGGESASVSWQLLSTAASCIAAVPADHWKGEYFNNMTLSGTPIMVRDDGTDVLNFNWGNEGSPSATCSVPGRQFSARWTRAVTFTAGTYAFSTTTDDGMRLYVDGQKVVDRWFDQGPSLLATNVSLTAGTHTIVVEYYQDTGGAVAAVSWVLVGAPPSVIPLTIGSVMPSTVTAGTSPTLTVTGTGFDPTFRAFLTSSSQTLEITAKAYVGTATVQVTPVVGGAPDPNAKLQITVGSQSATIGLPIVAAPSAPVVAITAPGAGATVSGTSVTLTATATAGTGLTITRVQFLVDNTNIGNADAASPYSAVLDTTKLANGPHTLTAVATDSANNATTSAPVGITVSNAVTTIAITSPVTGSTVSGSSVTILATASAGTGLMITSIQFRLDNGNLGAAVITSPYKMVLDTTTIANGAHSLTAIATDSVGNTTTSAAVNITVNNAVPAAAAPLVTSFNPGGVRNNYTGWLGMQFTVGSTPMNVTSLGRINIAGSTGTHIVKLVRASDGTDVPGTMVILTLSANMAGQFVYQKLASPVTLPANTSFYLVSQEINGKDAWYDISSVTATNAVSVNGPVYWNGLAWSLLGIARGAYVPVNLLYQ